MNAFFRSSRKSNRKALLFQGGEALSIAVHAMNSVAGPDGLSPILLVFGIVPRIPVRPADLQTFWSNVVECLLLQCPN